MKKILFFAILLPFLYASQAIAFMSGVSGTGTDTLADVADLCTLTGVACNATDLGTFTGTTITDNIDIKAAIQELETAVESVSAGGGDPILIDGVAVADASGVDIIGGSNGIDIVFNAGATPDTATINFDVTEAEADIEAAIDTLANLISIQSLTFTLADAGANAIFGWDDVAGAYENLTAGEALAIIGGAANDFDANGDVTITEADISDLSHTVDTGPSPDCAGDTTYQSGEGNCNDLSSVYLALSGGTLTGALLIDNGQELRIGEPDGAGTNYVAIVAPATLAANRTCTLEDDATPFDQCVSQAAGITQVGSCTDSSCYEGAGAETTLKSITDFIIELDDDTGGNNVFKVLNDSDATVLEVDESGVLTVQAIQDIDGPGTNWSISTSGAANFAGTVTAAAYATSGSSAPNIVADDTEDAGAEDLRISMNCATANDCSMGFGVDSGSDTLDYHFQIITPDSGNTEVWFGADATFDTTAPTNYIKIVTDGTPALTAVGTATITATEVTCTGCVADAELATDFISEAELASEGDLETQLGSINVIVATEIDSSSKLAGVIGDATGSGVFVLGTAPSLTGATVLNDPLIIDNDDGTANEIRLEEASASGNEYLGFATAARASSLTLTWNINTATCTGDGNAGALTINGSNEIVCSADDGGAGGSGDDVQVNASAPVESTVNFVDNLYIDWALNTTPSPDEITALFNYGATLAGNAALNAKECIFTTEGASGGGFLCEGSTGGNTNEQLYLFPAVDGADTTVFIATDATQITDLDGAGLGISAGALIVDTTELTNLTWSAGGGATIAHTYDVSGTDVVATWGSASLDIGAAVMNAGGFDASDGNITNVGDIALDSISADLTNISIVAASGTVTVESIVFTGNALSAVGSISDGTAQWSSSALSGFTSISTTGQYTGGTKPTIKTTAGSYTLGTTSANESYGGVVYMTSSGTLSLPAIAAGMNFTLIAVGAVTATIDPNGSEVIIRDGTTQSAGVTIVGTGATGDMAVCVYNAASTWYCSTGSNAGTLWAAGA